ncbi:hypothetical protein E2C01_016502 [Portunus trituberculatus]|uniref:Uncharacterized protein n=1 Tax=Portunus trituberculatus TaxID=210409 RepID=A0A5B7DR32_PORTR|nr:hypothetical protein [Portunus trituberculatus]
METWRQDIMNPAQTLYNITSIGRDDNGMTHLTKQEKTQTITDLVQLNGPHERSAINNRY